MGNESTSVGPSAPMKRPFSSAMTSSLTNRRDSSASPRTPESRSTFDARSTQRWSSTGSASCSSTPNTSMSPSGGGRRLRTVIGRRGRSPASIPSGRSAGSGRCGPSSGSSGLGVMSGGSLGGGGLRPLVGVDDVLHDAMPHDVAAGEVHPAQPVDAGEDLLEATEAAAAAGHVDLRGVAGDDRLRAEADAGEEHLHLLGRRSEEHTSELQSPMRT